MEDPSRPQGSPVGSVVGPKLPLGKQLPPAFTACHVPCSKQKNSWLHEFPAAAVTNYPKLGSRKQKKFSQQSKNQGVSRAVLPPEALGENLSLPLPASGGSWHSLACGSITLISASVFTWPSLCPCLKSPCPISYKDTNHWI